MVSCFVRFSCFRFLCFILLDFYSVFGLSICASVDVYAVRPCLIVYTERL